MGPTLSWIIEKQGLNSLQVTRAFSILLQGYVKLRASNHNTLEYTNTKAKRKYSKAWNTSARTELRESSELCTDHRNDLDYIPSARTKPNLEKYGPVESRLHSTCMPGPAGCITRAALQQNWVRRYGRNVTYSTEHWFCHAACSLVSILG
jgi:hypothetical protein